MKHFVIVCRTVCYLCLFVYSDVQHVLTIRVIWLVSYKKELLTLHEHLGSPPVFCGSVLLICFSFLCCVFCFVCLRPVSCVSNVANVSGFPILDGPVPLVFSNFYLLNKFYKLLGSS